MNIIHIIPNNAIGGLQKLCIELASQQIKRYKNVSVMTKVNEADGHKSFAGKMIFQFSFLQLFKLIKGESPTIVHTHGNTLTRIGWLALFTNKIQIIHTVHNEANFEAGKYRRIIHFLYFKFKLASPVVIANRLTEDFFNAYTLEPFGVVLNGIKYPSIENRKLNNNSFDLLFLGRLDYQKNINLLLEAVNLFHRKHKQVNIKLHVAGYDSGEYDMNLFQTLQSAGVVEYHGLLSCSLPLLSKCDCLCLSSRFEGLPLVAIEAKLNHLQIVSVDVGGIADIIEEDDVLLPRFVSPDEYCDAILNAYLKSNQKHISNIDFSIERVENEYSNIYSKVLHNTNNA